MKIAYYEENNYHTEIMGTFLNFFTKMGAEITVYNTKDMSATVSYFKQFSNFDLKPKTEMINDYNMYDKIFIGTSSSTKFFLNILGKNTIDLKKIVRERYGQTSIQRRIISFKCKLDR